MRHSQLVNDDLDLQDLEIYKSYINSKYLSIKHSSYFYTYEDLLSKYRGKKITFVEIGVLNGGSLFMWRDFFGSQARIIGIDFNPMAQKWEGEGFEIFIGNQADPEFWNEFFSKVGDVDVLLDDGGHANDQQIVTVHQSIPHIKDGGVLIVEDVHTSYFKEFGNPSKYSFISYTKAFVDKINSRFPSVDAAKHSLNKIVYSICFYESIVCFFIDRKKCFESTPTTNGGISMNAKDFRKHGTGKLSRGIKRLLSRLGFDSLNLKKYF